MYVPFQPTIMFLDVNKNNDDTESYILYNDENANFSFAGEVRNQINYVNWPFGHYIENS